MNAIAKALSDTIPSIPPDFEISGNGCCAFCGAGLLIVLVLALLGASFLPTEPQALNVMNWI